MVRGPRRIAVHTLSYSAIQPKITSVSQLTVLQYNLFLNLNMVAILSMLWLLIETSYTSFDEDPGS